MRTRHSRWGLLVLLSLWGWVPTAGGQQPPAEPEQALEEIVVTAARIPEALSQVSTAVTVITQQDLQRRQATTLAEALRSVPALSVIRSGTVGSITSVFARGGNSSHTLVLMDGVRVNSPTSGLFDFANITTDGVERIEVVRGPASALYGSDGLTTVINIISKKGEGKPRGSVRGDFGSYQTFREQATGAGEVGPVRYSAEVARVDSSGKFAHDEYNNTTGAVRLDSRVTPSLSLDLSTRYTHAFKNLPVVPGRLTPGQSQRQDLTTASFGATHTPTSWWDHRFQLSLVADDVDFRDPQGGFPSDTETTRMAADWQHNLRPTPWNTLSLGFQVEQAKGSRTNRFGFEDLNKTITDYAFYGQNRLAIWDRLILTAGVRIDENSAFGTHASPKYSAAFLIPETGSKLRASYGEGFRAPSINDLAFPGSSNPNLKPEKSRGLEFGADQTVWQDRVQVGLTWFQNRFRDLIQFSGAIPVNVDHARTQGVEATLTLHPGYGLDVVAGYTYLESVSQSSVLATADNHDLPRRPANTWNLAVNYAPWSRVNLNTNLLYVGKRTMDTAFDAGPTNPKYVKWDAAVSVTLLERAGVLRKLAAHGKVENILGDQYEEAVGFPAQGRSYLIGLSGEF